MLGVFAVILQVGVAAPIVGSGLCDRAPVAEAEAHSSEARGSFRTLITAAVVRWVRGDNGASANCFSARPATVPAPAPAPMPRSAAFALPWAQPPCDDNTDEQPKDPAYRPMLPDWAPPYSSLWIPEPELLLAHAPVDPECDDSLTAALAGGAELALTPRPVSDRPRL